MTPLDSLNPQQLQATQHFGGPLMIVAGPGSGKTRVIISRIAYLIEKQNVPPNKICAVTFTNRAAKEMKKRLATLLGPKSALIRASTFHSLCTTILRKEGRNLGIANNFVIYDEDDTINVLKLAMEDENIDQKQFPIRPILTAISKAKSQLQTPEAYQEYSSSFYEKVVSGIYTRYEELLHHSKALDFDDLLMKTVQLFESHPKILTKYQDTYLHLLVDEFQDTNFAQYALTRHIAAKNLNITVVGDPNQSIYSWRNADLTNILNFQKDYPTATVVNLEQNYRSSQNILKAAQHIIATNTEKLDLSLWTDNIEGMPVSIRQSATEEREASDILDEINNLLKNKKYSLSDCAIMYRVNAQSRVFEEACLKRGVPYTLIGGIRFYQRREIKDLIAYLRLIHNPDDDLSLKRIINIPSRKIGKKTVDDLTACAQENAISLFDVIAAITSPQTELANQPNFSTKQVDLLKRFVDIFKLILTECAGLPVVKKLERIIQIIEYDEYLQANEKSDERQSNVEELLLVAADHPAKDNLPNFLDGITLLSEQDRLSVDEQTKETVTLITLHQAKGLEYPIVFIAGVEEKMLPHVRSIDDPRQLEEERRVLYVGITRAQDSLYLWRSTLRRTYQGQDRTIPSRFLSDLPQDIVSSPTELFDTEFTDRVNASLPTIEKKPIQTFAPADRVRHPSFGNGIVVRCEQSQNSDEQVVTVQFSEDIGIKSLYVKYASLEIIL